MTEKCEMKVDDERHNLGEAIAEWLVETDSIGYKNKKYTIKQKVCNNCKERWLTHWSRVKRL
jgi:hypothetical protein